MSGKNVGFQGVTPYLRYEVIEEALEWLERVCGFEERSRWVDKDGVIKQAEVCAGEHEIWMSAHGRGYWETQEFGPEQYLIIWVDDVDAQWARVKSAGIDAPAPENQNYGVRNFYIQDPGGYWWGFHKRVSDNLPPGQSLEEGGLQEIRK